MYGLFQFANLIQVMLHSLPPSAAFVVSSVAYPATRQDSVDLETKDATHLASNKS